MTIEKIGQLGQAKYGRKLMSAEVFKEKDSIKVNFFFDDHSRHHLSAEREGGKIWLNFGGNSFSYANECSNISDSDCRDPEIYELIGPADIRTTTFYQRQIMLAQSVCISDWTSTSDDQIVKFYGAGKKLGSR